MLYPTFVLSEPSVVPRVLKPSLIGGFGLSSYGHSEGVTTAHFDRHTHMRHPFVSSLSCKHLSPLTLAFLEADTRLSHSTFSATLPPHSFGSLRLTVGVVVSYCGEYLIAA